MYRGIHAKESKSPIFISQSPKNRIPTDTPGNIHKLLDDLFLQKFGWRARSDALFCSGDMAQAGFYGATYEIYPANGFKFVWSERIRDLYHEHGIFKYSTDIYRGQDRPTDEDIEEHFVQALKTYRNDDLGAALYSGHEIMVSSDKYAAKFSGL